MRHKNQFYQPHIHSQTLFQTPLGYTTCQKSSKSKGAKKSVYKIFEPWEHEQELTMPFLFFFLPFSLFLFDWQCLSFILFLIIQFMPKHRHPNSPISALLRIALNALIILWKDLFTSRKLSVVRFTAKYLCPNP